MHCTHLSQQTRCGNAFVNSLCGHRCLDQRLAVMAHPFATDMLFYREHPPRVVQLLRNILPNAFELAAATASAGVGFVVDFYAGQACGQGCTFDFATRLL